MPALLSCLSAFDARDVNAADAPFLARLYASTRPDLIGNGDANPAFADALVAMHQRMQAADYLSRFPQARYLLLHAHGEPVGRIVTSHAARCLHLVDIALLPQARGKGIGSAAVRALQHWATRHDAALTLTVQAANTGARRLYQRLGFEGDSMAGRLRWTPPDFISSEQDL